MMRPLASGSHTISPAAPHFWSAIVLSSRVLTSNPITPVLLFLAFDVIAQAMRVPSGDHAGPLGQRNSGLFRLATTPSLLPSTFATIRAVSVEFKNLTK